MKRILMEMCYNDLQLQENMYNSRKEKLKVQSNQILHSILHLVLDGPTNKNELKVRNKCYSIDKAEVARSYECMYKYPFSNPLL